MQSTLSKSWHQEPWVWFNLVLLISASIAAMIMTAIAIKNTPAEIDSRWYQDGALAKLQRQQVALVNDIHLQATMKISNRDSINISLKHDQNAAANAAGETLSPSSISLYLEHASQPELDQTIKLIKQKDGRYTGKFTQMPSGKYYLMLAAPKNTWYLTGKSSFPASDAITLSVT